MQSSSTTSSESTRHKGKEIAKLVTPKSESVSEEDSDPEQARRDKDMKRFGTHLRILQEAVQTYQQQPSNFFKPGTRLKIPYQGSQSGKMDWLRGHGNEEFVLNKNWKHITATWQRFRRSHLKNPVLLKDDSNVIPDSSNVCTNDIRIETQAVRNTNVLKQERIGIAPPSHKQEQPQLPHASRLYQLITISLFDSGCTKDMTAISSCVNFVEKFLGTVHFGMISLLQFLVWRLIQKGMSDQREIYLLCESLQGNDLLTGYRVETDLTSISLQDHNFINSNLFMAKRFHHS
ncbi:hypothetical protein Tco_1093806 [Tanacetum coccineum]|uniref:Uncharacterized protein n=1 Tax=Tanacetum coccineum TaxID=301880 RepID=A0ABQ5IG32_9ASTR